MIDLDPSIWDGDGLPDYDDWRSIISELGMLPPEMEGWLGACKKEAWIHEHLAKHEDQDYNLAVTRFYWRRVEKLREYIKKLDAEGDAS